MVLEQYINQVPKQYVNFQLVLKKDLTKLIVYLEKYHLLTQKELILCCSPVGAEAMRLIKDQSHISINGLNKIVNIKASATTGE